MKRAQVFYFFTLLGILAVHLNGPLNAQTPAPLEDKSPYKLSSAIQCFKSLENKSQGQSWYLQIPQRTNGGTTLNEVVVIPASNGEERAYHAFTDETIYFVKDKAIEIPVILAKARLPSLGSPKQNSAALLSEMLMSPSNIPPDQSSAIAKWFNELARKGNTLLRAPQANILYKEIGNRLKTLSENFEKRKSAWTQKYSRCLDTFPKDYHEDFRILSGYPDWGREILNFEQNCQGLGSLNNPETREITNLINRLKETHAAEYKKALDSHMKVKK